MTKRVNYQQVLKEKRSADEPIQQNFPYTKSEVGQKAITLVVLEAPIAGIQKN